MRFRSIIHVILTLSAVLAFDGTARSATVIVGTPSPDPGGGNCLPFNCPSYFQLNEYQQVYSSAAFSGSILIDHIIFYNYATIDYLFATFASGNFKLLLSYTPKPVNGLNTNLTENVGSDSTTVFYGSLPALAGGELVIPLSTSFMYDPLGGNLLLQILISGTIVDGPGFLVVDNSGDVTSSAYNAPNYTSSIGLVTGFESSPSAAPLPAALPLFVTGLGALGLLGWRRKRRLPCVTPPMFGDA